MKTIMKLVFVGLLVGCVLGIPKPARAGDTCYGCTSGMGTCLSSAQEWMGECIGNCPHQGTDEQICYPWAIWDAATGQLDDSSYCGDYPSAGADCIEDCSMEMTTTVANCTGSYCGSGYPC